MNHEQNAHPVTAATLLHLSRNSSKAREARELAKHRLELDFVLESIKKFILDPTFTTTIEKFAEVNDQPEYSLFDTWYSSDDDLNYMLSQLNQDKEITDKLPSGTSLKVKVDRPAGGWLPSSANHSIVLSWAPPEQKNNNSNRGGCTIF